MNPSTLQELVTNFAGISGTILSICLLIFAKKKKLEKEVVYLIYLSIMYPFGKFTQYHFFYPSFIRWHLADAGWVPFWTVASAGIYSCLGILNQHKYPVSKIKAVAIRVAFWSTFAALWGEILTGFAKYISPNGPNPTKVAGDWIDAAIYIVMLFVTLRLINKAFPKMNRNPFWTDGASKPLGPKIKLRKGVHR